MGCISYFVSCIFIIHVQGSGLKYCRLTGNDIDCSHSNIKTIPADLPGSVVSLDLSNNDISKLYNRSFQKFINLTVLSLSHNSITEVEFDAFYGLNKLTKLELQHNMIDYICMESYGHLVNLNILSISENSFKIKIEEQARNITKLFSLQELSMEIYVGFNFPLEFKQLVNLTYIGLESGGGSSGLMKYQKSTFQAISTLPIRSLNLYCFQSISNDTFYYLNFLTSLTMQICTDVPTNPVLDIFRSLSVFKKRNMSSITFSGNRYRNNFKLGFHHLKYVWAICLRSFTLHSMFITYIEQGAFRYFADRSKCLENFEMTDNIIFDEDGVILSYIQSFKSLKVLTLRNHKLVRKRRSYYGNFSITLPQTLQELHIESMFTSLPSTNFIFRQGLNLRVLRLPNNHVYDCSFSIIGLPNVTYFDMSNWQCSKLSDNLLSGFPNLETYIASKSSIGKCFKNARNLPLLFKNSLNLKYIDLSQNAISVLPKALFMQTFDKLESINLGYNKLTFLPRFKAKMLTKIDLTFNNITSLTDKETAMINKLPDLKLFMQGNPLQCTCSTFKFLHWIKTMDNIGDLKLLSCILENGSQQRLSTVLANLKQFEISCSSKFWLIFSIAMCSVLNMSLLLAILYHRHKYAIEYLWRRANRQEVFHLYFKFDAYITYSESDFHWVKTFYDVIVKMGFQLCLEEKDFIPGTDIAENILTAIDSSRWVIFVLTKNYLTKKWSTYEMEMTRMHAFQRGSGNMVIVILKDNLNVSDMPKILKNMLCRMVCIKWPDKDSARSIQTERLLYDNVEFALRSNHGESFLYTRSA